MSPNTENLITLQQPNSAEVGGEQVFHFEDPDEYRTFCERAYQAGYHFPQCLSGVDVEYGLRNVLHLRHLSNQTELTISCDVPYDNPRIPSVTDLWSGVEWYEREAYDLLGINYEKHPDLRRILLEEDWTIHPLQRRYNTNGYLNKAWQAKSWPNLQELDDNSVQGTK